MGGGLPQSAAFATASSTARSFCFSFKQRPAEFVRIFAGGMRELVDEAFAE